MRHRKAATHLAAKFFLFAFCSASALTAGSLTPGLTQSPEKRKLEVRTFNRMPLKVKQIRNLQKEDDDWFRDLEIEVENISDKPIYFISLIIEFPNIPAAPPETRPDGSTPSRSTTGFRLTYGAGRLIDVRQLATPDDIPLRPSETYIFKIPDSRVLGLEHMKQEKNLTPEATDKIDIEFDTISFGDGTGYIAGEMRMAPKKKE